MAKKKPKKSQCSNNAVTDDSVSVSGTKPAPSGPSHDELAQRAHQLWLEGGCQPNCEHANWLEAEKQLCAKDLTRGK